ncbi:MAG: hypothetical protein QXP42_03050 [Candidatus Micrarchaeia archaeon]
MSNFRIKSSFYPLSLTAYTKCNVELTLEIENIGNSDLWTECDVHVPEALSLAPDRSLQKGRLRIGIINPGETRYGRCKVYSSSKSYPDVFPVKLVVYGFGKDGAIVAREEKTAHLRCERIG